MKVLILCAGQQTRWTGELPKQLADFGGEPLLARTIRQVVRRGHTPIVVTNHPEIKEAVQDKAQIFAPTYARWLMETVHQTRDLWDGPMAALLGDVCFTGAALDMIFQDVAVTPHLYGTASEIFAVRFVPGDMYALYVPYGYAGAHPDDPTAGRLWSLYRSLYGMPNNQHFELRHTGDPYFTYIEDGTGDIDDWDGYQALKAKYDAGELPEEPEPRRTQKGQRNVPRKSGS